ncbi:hypothetical protein [Microlunatus soli]|uniref:N-acetyltransferase domain-containing protein n=1 Tax=Microlunatus soli TaxID=630515 RepID=A0A1H2A345_9ACTN|nr:hypothetical protein [Microlunatus soli]SDT40303.1 hypothetical protein SAMN04489812_5631 [Microlunatus soli]
MTAWSADAVRRAAADWEWLPDGTRTVGSDLKILDYPDWTGVGVQAKQVDSDRQAKQIIEDASDQARAWGRDKINWWVGDSTRPADLEAELAARGAVHEETVAILALDLGDWSAGSRAAAGITAEQVRTREQYVDLDAVNVSVWDQQPITPDRLDRQLGEDAARGEFRVIGRLDGAAVCTAGCTVVDGVARLWGAATVESARRRGAYRAVLDLRLQLARDAGATLALVKGRTDTSAPILRRAGFTDYGEERILVLPLGAGPD